MAKKTKVALSPEEQGLVKKLHDKREQLAKIRKEMDALEEQIRPLSAKRVATEKVRRAGLTKDEIAALGGGKK